MPTMTIGQFKSSFSSVLKKVRNGQEVVIGYGKKKEKVAVLIPYHHYHRMKNKRKLGPLKNKAKCILKPDFSITEEEFLTS